MKRGPSISIGPLARFLRTLGVLLTGTVISSALAFLTQVILTRQLKIEEVGIIAALLTTINFLTPSQQGA